VTIKNPNDPASDAQLNRLRLEVGRRQIADEAKTALKQRLAAKSITKGRASEWIERLLKAPLDEETDLAKVVKHLRDREQQNALDEFTDSLLRQYEERGTLTEKQMAAVMRKVDGGSKSPLGSQMLEDAQKVPAGRYAVQGIKQGQLADWTLLRVWKGTRNPNVVHVYVVKGTEEGERLGPVESAVALRSIAQDPGKAALEFGHRTGCCSRCAAALDKNLSRKLGVGPTCMKHWFDPEQRHSMNAKARKELRDAGLDPEAKLDDLSVVA
jgi:hypothetical protein